MLLNRTPQLKSQLNAALKRTPKPAAPTPVKADDDLAKAIAESLKIDEAKKEADDDLAKVLALSAQDMANIEAKQALPREALVPYQTPDAQRQPGLKLTPKITRIRVTQQNQADCGLHTVLNALWSEKLLKGEIDQSGFSKQITDQDNAKKIEELRAAAMGKNKAWVEASGWIHADAANYLMQQQLSGSAVAPRPTNPNTLPWTIIENITAEHEHIMTTSTMLNYGAPLTAALQKLRNQPKASHIFLVCNTSYTENPDAEDIADRYVGERGHWIAVLVRNEPKVRHYIVQDSLNGDPTESVQALQRFIDSADIEKAIAEEKSTAAVNQVTQARSAIATEAYTRAGELLKAAKPTIEKWRKQNFKNDVVKLFDDLREELALYDY
jgi:hypothetical protein